MNNVAVVNQGNNRKKGTWESGEIPRVQWRARVSLAGESNSRACDHWSTLGSDPNTGEITPTDSWRKNWDLSPEECSQYRQRYCGGLSSFQASDYFFSWIIQNLTWHISCIHVTLDVRKDFEVIYHAVDLEFFCKVQKGEMLSSKLLFGSKKYRQV